MSAEVSSLVMIVVGLTLVDCHVIVHMKHVDNDEGTVHPCVGNVEVIKYIFKAPTPEGSSLYCTYHSPLVERERWCKVFTNVIKRRGLVKLERERSQRSKLNLIPAAPSSAGSDTSESTLVAVSEIDSTEGMGSVGALIFRPRCLMLHPA